MRTLPVTNNFLVMKSFSMLIIAALVLSVTACETKKEKEAAEQQMSKADSLELVINQMRNETDDLNGMKLKLTDIMRQINEAENRITNISPETSSNQIVVENMAFIKQKMEEYRRTVAEMQQQLRNSNQLSQKAKKSYETDIYRFQEALEGKNAEIDSLRVRLAEKDLVITEQGAVILEQGKTVNDLLEENAEKEEVLVEQDRKLHTAWYVYGTKKELEEHHIVEKGKVMSSESVNKDYFTAIDIRVTKVIPLHSKKVKLLSAHPATSYKLDKDAQGIYTLRITDPELFWSVNKYLVISVK